MAVDLSPKQALAIYYLLFTGKTPLQSKMTPALNPGEREQLVAEKLIAKQPAPRGGKLVVATDDAWSWAEMNMGRDLGKSPAGTEALQFLLGNLKRYLGEREIRLAELLTPTKPKAKSLRLTEEIHAAYLHLVDGATGVPVRISKLALALPNIAPSVLKEELSNLRREHRVTFSRSDDPLSTTEADRLYEIEADGAINHFVTFKF